MKGFEGDIEQVPPMYSALKKDGKRLYELARKGEIVERDARPIRIDEIDLLEASGTRLVFRVHCSKGTYVRTLVEDIAKAAGTVAHTARLHRETVGDFGRRTWSIWPVPKRRPEPDLGTCVKAAVAGRCCIGGWPACQGGRQRCRAFQWRPDRWSMRRCWGPGWSRSTDRRTLPGGRRAYRWQQCCPKTNFHAGRCGWRSWGRVKKSLIFSCFRLLLDRN